MPWPTRTRDPWLAVRRRLEGLRLKILWETRLGTSVQGFPVAFTAGGKEYIAVTTGLGGGSPRQVPRALIPEVHHPNSGHAVYVFELPDRR